MKKITLLLFLFISSFIYSQKTGITYQALIFNPNGANAPEVNNTNVPLANKNICLQFSIIDTSSSTEYQETINTTTDEYGMVNTIIGSGIQTSGYALSFLDVNWGAGQKGLKVAIDTNGQCANFVQISNQLFTSVPFTFSALTAENVTGLVSIESGGTNATTVLGAKTNLALEKVDNTSDLNKPISLATQTALNHAEEVANKSINVATDGASDTKYPSVKSVKTYVDAILTNSLTAEIIRATTAETTLTTNLESEASTARVAEKKLQDNIDLKANVASPTFTGTPTLPTGTIGVTQTAGDNTTALATTAFVTAAASSSKFVNLASNQTIAGIKTFSSDVNINGLTIGRGNFNENSNTAIGLGALENNAGYANTAIGRGALAVNNANGGNTALGYIALSNNISGADNVAVGSQSLETNISGSENTAIGKHADVALDGISNAVAIGANAIVTASNTIQLGSDGSGSHTAIIAVKTSGTMTASSYIKSGGTSSQYLMADGSVTSGPTSVRDVTDEFSATDSQTTFTLAQIPSVNCKVKMYVNGIRISNLAYSVSGTTLTYIPSNNGGYVLTIGDRIQMDFYY